MNAREKLDKIINDLSLRKRFTFSEFVESVQVYSAKDVTFVPWKFPPHVTGACLQSENTIYVFYAESTPPAYQTIVKLHELVHVVLGYTQSILDREEEKLVKNTILGTHALYMPQTNKFVMRSLLLRNDMKEKEVDELALMITHRLLPERSGAERDLTQIDLD